MSKWCWFRNFTCIGNNSVHISNEQYLVFHILHFAVYIAPALPEKDSASNFDPGTPEKNLRNNRLHISNVTVPRVPNPPIHNILIRHYEQWIQHQILTQKGNFDAEKIFRDSGIHISNVTVTQRSKLTNSQYIAPATPGMDSASNFDPGRCVSRRKKFRNNGIHI